MKSYKDYQVETEQKIRSIKDHFESHHYFFELAHELRPLWSRAVHYKNKDELGRSSSVGYCEGAFSVNCVYLDCYFGPDDNFSLSAAEFLDAHIMDRNDLIFSHQDDYLKNGWRGWAFRGAPVKVSSGKMETPTLLIRFWFKDSSKCQLVGTGQFEEVQELKCA